MDIIVIIGLGFSFQPQLEFEFFIVVALKEQRNCVRSHSVQSKKNNIKTKNKINQIKIDIVCTEQELYKSKKSTVYKNKQENKEEKVRLDMHWMVVKK